MGNIKSLNLNLQQRNIYIKPKLVNFNLNPAPKNIIKNKFDAPDV